MKTVWQGPDSLVEVSDQDARWYPRFEYAIHAYHAVDGKKVVIFEGDSSVLCNSPMTFALLIRHWNEVGQFTTPQWTYSPIDRLAERE